MKASKFSEGQIAFVLKHAEDGTPVGNVCHKAGIWDAAFYNWRKKYGGFMPSEMKRLRQLEEENAKLKRIVADLFLDKAMLQDVLSKSFEACLVLEVHKEIQARQEEANQLRSHAIERAQTEADLAQRRFMLADPNNRLVVDTLESEWNEKLRILANAREEREQSMEPARRSRSCPTTNATHDKNINWRGKRCNMNPDLYKTGTP